MRKHSLSNLPYSISFQKYGRQNSKFINDLLYHYCLNKKIAFRRSHPYKKNKQVHVEQKNWSVVRHAIGYVRLDSDAQYAILQSIYKDLHLYVNFFQPILKLIGKEHICNQVVRNNFTARTPYQRVLEQDVVPLAKKAKLLTQSLCLNPADLHRSIDEHVARLWSTLCHA